MPSTATDFLIIGGGVIGLNLAVNVKRHFPDAKVMLIEKEKGCGLHASGRNSGILHAGFYYTSDSLKARFTREGNRLLTEYCLERGLKINRCGKLVVTTNTDQLAALDQLLLRGNRNNVQLHEITEGEAKQIEPHVKTCQKALYSPTTSSVDPGEIITCLVKDAGSVGIVIQPDTAFLSHDKRGCITSRGIIDAKYIINAAGLYADKIARNFGFSRKYRILPFKGLYLTSKPREGAIRTNIYPVPDLKNPFLGAHFTIAVDGTVKIGPTAIPAFWREHYRGLENFNFSELIEIVLREAGLLVNNNFGFRRLAIEELSKYCKPVLIRKASMLASGVSDKYFKNWGAAGIRAQLYNMEERKLEMDFCFEGDSNSFHVLNAVSPAFTCSIPFTQFLLEEIELLLSGNRDRGNQKLAINK